MQTMELLQKELQSQKQLQQSSQVSKTRWKLSRSVHSIAYHSGTETAAHRCGS
jgi:hypothetical protein